MLYPARQSVSGTTQLVTKHNYCYNEQYFKSDLWSWVQSCYGDKSNRVRYTIHFVFFHLHLVPTIDFKLCVSPYELLSPSIRTYICKSVPYITFRPNIDWRHYLIYSYLNLTEITYLQHPWYLLERDILVFIISIGFLIKKVFERPDKVFSLETPKNPYDFPAN